MSRHILLIDDDPDLPEVIRFVLQAEGFQVTTNNSFYGMEQIRDADPDIILLDEWLDQKHPGSTICRWIKKQRSLSQVRVILISAHNGLAESVAQCGADGYLIKPFTRQSLLAMLQ